MPQLAILAAFLVLLFPVGVGIWFYVRFERLPIRKKSRAIEKAAQALRVQKEEHPKKRQAIARDFAARIESVRERALASLLRGYPLSKLAEYPGIGPATVDKLHKAGVQDLPSLASARLEAISGFGQKRTADIRAAFQALHKEAASRLDSGACSESRQIEPQKRALQNELQLRLAESDFLNQWRTNTLQVMGDTIEQAHKVAFIPWLFGATLPDTLPDLPDLTAPAYAAPAVEAPKADALPESPLPAPSVKPSTQAASATKPRPTQVEVAYRSEPDTSHGQNESGQTIPAPEAWIASDEMEIAARIGLAVGTADGRFSEKEQVVVRRFLNEIYGGDPEKKNRIGTILSACSRQKVELEQVLAATIEQVAPSRWPALVALAAQVADAGSKRGVQETAVIEQIRKALVSPKQAKSAKDERSATNQSEKTAGPTLEAPANASAKNEAQRPPAAALTPRRSLEILESAPLSARLVRAQWKAMRDKFDPAKFAGHGEEFAAMAQAKRLAVDDAAKALLQELGEPPTLEEPVKDLRHNPDLDAAFGL